MENLVSEPDPHEQREGSGQYIVLCPDRVHLLARNSLVNEVEFLALIPQSGKDQWDYKISNYYVLQHQNF